jgi:hypothetical protein
MRRFQLGPQPVLAGTVFLVERALQGSELVDRLSLLGLELALDLVQERALALHGGGPERLAFGVPVTLRFPKSASQRAKDREASLAGFVQGALEGPNCRAEPGRLVGRGRNGLATLRASDFPAALLGREAQRVLTMRTGTFGLRRHAISR